jgi:DNA polymerase mu
VFVIPKGLYRALSVAVTRGGGEAREDGRGGKDAVNIDNNDRRRRSPTHVVVPNDASEDTLAAATRSHPGAKIVTHAWVSSTSRGEDPSKRKREEDEANAATTKRKDLGSRREEEGTLATTPAPAHPNLALILPRPVATEEDHRAYGRVPGKRMGKLELCLQCRFDASTSLNEDVVAVLVELEKYERVGGGAAAQHDDNKSVGYNEMEGTAAKWAAVVRALPYRITAKRRPKVEDGIPFLGRSACETIRQFASTGTCDAVDAHKAGASGGAVLRHTSNGRLRTGATNVAAAHLAPASREVTTTPRALPAATTTTTTTTTTAVVARDASRDRDGVVLAEAAAARSLCALPSIGRNTARGLLRCGVRTLEELRRRLEDGDQAVSSQLDGRQRYAIRHADELTSPVPIEDFEEMRSAVLKAAKNSRRMGSKEDDDAWEVIAVGGGRRNEASHDADFLLTHPKLRTPWEMRGLLDKILEGMPEVLGEHGDDKEAAFAFRMVTDGVMGNFWEKVSNAKRDLGKQHEGKSRGNADYYDKIYGVFRTAAGRHRRIDIVLVPHDQLPFALIGWTGSKQYNRFIRHHANSRGLYFNSHGLFRTHDRKAVGSLESSYNEAYATSLKHLKCPPPAPSRDAAGNDWWPPGWDETRVAKTERDVFELLGVPFQPPTSRDCPS